MKLYFIAGEASGDLHAKNLIIAMKKHQPALELRGVGGNGMREEGVDLTRHVSETNYMGWAEVLKNLGAIRKLFKDVKKAILEQEPDAVILIDYPGFNLRMARFLKKRGIRVFYYVSPQVWAWKKKRVKTIRKYVDKLFVILPFELDFYRNEGLEVDFVGHPLLDELEKLQFEEAKIRKSFGLDERPVIGLLPGSREQEIRRKLPIMGKVISQFPQFQFVIAGAPDQPLSLYKDLLPDTPAVIAENKTYQVLAIASFALVTSGTATLETALFRVPQVVCYSGPPLSVWFAKRLINVPYISLVNLIMEKMVVKELIQKDLTPENLKKELETFFQNPEKRLQIKADYESLREKLGDTGASERTALLILKYLKSAGAGNPAT